MTHNKKISRREFVKRSALGAAGIAATSSFGVPFASASGGPYIKSGKISNKVIVLGMDGMDPVLLRKWMAQGELPTFKRLAENGQFGSLGTTMPPQSPVAWSSFITGTDPGGTGIYDFIHRDPKAFMPYLSTSRSLDAPRNLKLGDWQIPLGGGEVNLMRKGRPFWGRLSEHGIPSTVFQIPANYPVDATPGVNAVSGMGTPDMIGSYGTFTYLTEENPADYGDFAGGKVIRVTPRNHIIETKIDGPPTPFKVAGEPTFVEIKAYRDPRERVIKFSIQGQDFILKQGEWSEWIPLSFPMLSSFSTVAGMVRLYIKEVHPQFKVYVSPVNIDPMDTTMPICYPQNYCQELSQIVGRFYTQGFPADQKALSEGVLSNEEYLQQADIVLEESLANFDFELNRFNEGMFFFYFSTIDQNSHMMWRNMDPEHPLYEPNESPRVKNAILNFYKSMDEVLRQTLGKVDSQTTLLCLSDHGFAPFTREFNLSTWLVEKGYTTLTDPDMLGRGEFFRHVDWSKTKAYALGINGIYFNVRGRENRGSVDPGEMAELKKQLAADLQTVRDPQNGAPIITQAYDPYEIYSGAYVDLAPDLVLGYNSGYRISDDAVLGKFPKEIVRDRKDLWAADHCVDPKVVPGILLSNRNWSKKNPGLWDMGPSILELFGLDPYPEMTGRSIFSSS